MFELLHRLLRRRPRTQKERDLDDEIRFHLAEETRLRIERGAPPEEARASARLDFGNIPLVTEITRATWGWSAAARIAQDLRFAGRMLARSPAFTVVALCTLALGIGATTAIFTVVNGVLLRPLPFPEPDRLVVVRERSADVDPATPVSPQTYADWRARARPFERIAAVRHVPMNVVGRGEAEQLPCLQVTGDFFSILGVPPLLGRTIRSGEDVEGGARTVVLSHAFWQRRYGGSRAVLGRQISINEESHEIVGVMPAGFSFPGHHAELFVALQIGSPWAPLGDTGRSLSTVARVHRGAGLQTAQAELEAVTAQLARERSWAKSDWSATIVPLIDQAVGSVRPALLVLFGAVLCVLLIACANIANLLLMRATARTREMTVRTALGAGRWRLVHQLAVECLLLAGAGGIAGVGLARIGVPIILSMFPETLPLPRAAEIGMDHRVLLFTMLVSIGAGLCFGLVPAFRVSGANAADALRSGGRTVVAGASRARALLVVTEVALALLLVIVAGLMARSLAHLYRTDLGFRPERVLTLQMGLFSSKYMEPSRRVAVLDEILERVRALPGVAAAGSIHFLPLSGIRSSTSVRRLDQPAPAPGERGPGAAVSVITPGYLHAMGVPLIAGRDFNAGDRLATPRVALVNQALVRQFFSSDTPLGKRLRVEWGGSHTGRKGPPEFEVVGVVGNVRHDGPHLPPEPYVFLSHRQEASFTAALVIRTAADPLAIAPAIRHQIRQVDPEQGISHVRTMETVVADSVARPRLQAVLLGAFGTLALVMACVGLYGLMSYSVAQRAREMGVRLALGAAPSSIRRLVVGEGLRLTAAGLLVGFVAALLLTRYLATLLYGVTPSDPAVFIAVGALLLTVAMTACYLPARRATRIDPAHVLRDE
ncbi:MAG: ADOP family duplicated permease [Vicinamibacteraceae bacterium]